MGWTTAATPPTDFFADRISGAQRLANGDTLICQGPAGRFFEVDDPRLAGREFTPGDVLEPPAG